MENLLTGDLLDWLSSHTRWLGLAIFLIALIESLAIAGLVVPGVLLLFAATALAGGGNLSLMSALILAFAGAVCGDLLSFIMGRYFHQDIRRLRIFVRHPQWIDRGEYFFRRYGTFSVFLGRFIGPIRPIIPMIAGMLDMPALRFLLVNVLSALIWAPVYVVPGYLAGNAARWAVPDSFWHQALGLGGGLALLGLALLMLLRTQTRWSSLAAAALCLLGMLSLTFAAPWLDVLYGTLHGWLDSNQHPRLNILRSWLIPLTAEAFLLITYVPLIIMLAILRLGWQLLFLMLGALLCLALGLFPSHSSTELTLVLLLISGVTMLANRNQTFWLRLSWGLYALPACALLLTAWLTRPIAVPTVLASILQAACALLLTIWLIERSGPMKPLPRPWVFLLPVWPVVVGALLLSGF